MSLPSWKPLLRLESTSAVLCTICSKVAPLLALLQTSARSSQCPSTCRWALSLRYRLAFSRHSTAVHPLLFVCCQAAAAIAQTTTTTTTTRHYTLPERSCSPPPPQLIKSSSTQSRAPSRTNAQFSSVHCSALPPPLQITI